MPLVNFFFDKIWHKEYMWLLIKACEVLTGVTKGNARLDGLDNIGK